MKVLPVPPPKARPAQFTEGGLSIHPQSSALQEVIHSTIIMKKLVELTQVKWLIDGLILAVVDWLNFRILVIVSELVVLFVRLLIDKNINNWMGDWII